MTPECLRCRRPRFPLYPFLLAKGMFTSLPSSNGLLLDSEILCFACCRCFGLIPFPVQFGNSCLLVLYATFLAYLRLAVVRFYFLCWCSTDSCRNRSLAVSPFFIALEDSRQNCIDPVSKVSLAQGENPLPLSRKKVSSGNGGASSPYLCLLVRLF